MCHLHEHVSTDRPTLAKENRKKKTPLLNRKLRRGRKQFFGPTASIIIYYYTYIRRDRALCSVVGTCTI